VRTGYAAAVQVKVLILLVFILPCTVVPLESEKSITWGVAEYKDSVKVAVQRYGACESVVISVG